MKKRKCLFIMDSGECIKGNLVGKGFRKCSYYTKCKLKKRK